MLQPNDLEVRQQHIFTHRHQENHHECINVNLVCNSKYTKNIFQLFLGPPSPGSNYPSNSPQVSRNGAPGSAVGYQSSQQPSAFSAYMNYMPSSASYANQMARARGPSQMPSKFSVFL